MQFATAVPHQLKLFLLMCSPDLFTAIASVSQMVKEDATLLKGHLHCRLQISILNTLHLKCRRAIFVWKGRSLHSSETTGRKGASRQISKQLLAGFGDKEEVGESAECQKPVSAAHNP